MVRLRGSRLLRLLALVGVLVLVAAACDDNDGDAGGSADPGQGDGGDADQGDEVADVSGEPIKVMVIGELEGNRGYVAGAEARATAINSSGGIDGRPIDVLTCDSANDPNAAGECARNAVSEDVVAIVAQTTGQGDAIFPVLEENGICSVGNSGFGAADISHPNSFPFVSGAPGVVGGMATLLADALDIENIHMAYTDIETGAQAIDLGDAMLATRGLSTSGSTPVPLASGDLSPQVAAATSDSGGVALSIVTEQIIAFLQAAQQANVEVPLAVAGFSFADQQVEQLGEAAEGVYVTTTYLPVSANAEGHQQMLAELEAAGETDVPTDDATINSWLSVYVLGEILPDLDTIDSASICEAMGQIEGLDMLGLSPPLTTTEELDFPGMNRIFNPTVVYNQVQDGEIVPLTGDFVSPFSAPE